MWRQLCQYASSVLYIYMLVYFWNAFALRYEWIEIILLIVRPGVAQVTGCES